MKKTNVSKPFLLLAFLSSFFISSVAHADRAAADFDLSVRLWAEAGRRLYPLGATIMAARSHGSTSLTTCEKIALRPHHGGLVDRIAIHYGVTPLDRWAEGLFRINLTGTESEAQTYGHDIYMAQGRDRYTDLERLGLLSHEMVHSEQFERLGSSLEEFGYHYFKQYKVAGSYEGNIYEKEARAKSAAILSEVLGAYQRCVGGRGRAPRPHSLSDPR